MQILATLQSILLAFDHCEDLEQWSAPWTEHIIITDTLPVKDAGHSALCAAVHELLLVRHFHCSCIHESHVPHNYRKCEFEIAIFSWELRGDGTGNGNGTITWECEDI